MKFSTAKILARCRGWAFNRKGNKLEEIITDSDNGKYRRVISRKKVKWYFWACGWQFTHDTTMLEAIYQAGRDKIGNG